MGAALFFTNITLEKIEKTPPNRWEGIFSLDIEPLHIYNRLFRFFIKGDNFEQADITIYKNDKVFVERKGIDNKRRETAIEQEVILFALKIILGADNGTLNLEGFAHRRAMRFGKLSVDFSTPDILGEILSRACM